MEGSSVDRRGTADGQPLLHVRDLQIHNGDVPLVRGVDLEVAAGEIVSVVGESGSGKSLTSLAMLSLVDPALTVTGSIEFHGKDIARLNKRGLRRYRASSARMIFQDPASALNPLLTLGDQLIESVRASESCSKSEARNRAMEMVRKVGIAEPERCLRSYPREMSGGMLQRVVIAMALVVNPALLICDEPTTALDVTTQAQVLDLIRTLTSDLNTGVVLTTHDMGIAAEYSDRLVVMYAGQLVETGPTDRTMATPQHPYLWSLINAHPDAGERAPHTPLTTLSGAPPPPNSELPGCRFAPRCPFVEDRCLMSSPPLTVVPTDPARAAACHITAAAGQR